MNKIIIDITYMNRPPRLYIDYAPSLRAEREGFLVVGKVYEQTTRDYSSRQFIRTT